MLPMRTPAPVTPRAHAVGAPTAGIPQTGPGVGKEGGRAPVVLTGASGDTVATPSVPSSARISERVARSASAFTSQNRRAGASAAAITSGWERTAVRRSARSSSSGAPA
jgi:hypothetical protein